MLVSVEVGAQRLIEADMHNTVRRQMGWQVCVGAGRAAEGLRADWQEQLRLVKKEIGFQYIRFHGLLCDEMHIYAEDKQGEPQYNFQYVDKLYDFLLSIGIRPFVELGFMPPDLASGTKTIFWWKGNVTPPKSYERWYGLIKALVTHFEQRYGREEVNRWYFEVWNEPDLRGFFDGTRDQYFQLYETTAKAIKSVSPSYRVGGPATSGSKWIPEMIAFCKEKQLPLDFISTHCYNTKNALDEFGTNKRRLLAADYLWSHVLKSRHTMDSAGLQQTELHYTEFNSSPSSRDPLHDTYQNAAWLLNTLKRTEHSASSMSYWTFTDIFEEGGPAMTSFHGGFGLLNLQGIKKPTFYAYKFMNQLGPTELRNADTCSWVCTDGHKIQALFWNLHLPFGDTTQFNEVRYRKLIAAPSAGTVEIRIAHVPDGDYLLTLYKTGDHVNDPYSAYMEMGAPANIDRQQETALKKLSSGAPVLQQRIRIANGRFEKQFSVKENDACLLELEPAAKSK